MTGSEKVEAKSTMKRKPCKVGFLKMHVILDLIAITINV
jgi:hypothetical protein